MLSATLIWRETPFENQKWTKNHEYSDFVGKIVDFEQPMCARAKYTLFKTKQNKMPLTNAKGVLEE